MRINNEKSRSEYSGIWVFCEICNGRMLPVSLELLSEAVRLAEKKPQKITALVLTDQLGEENLNTLWAYGADIVIAAEDASFRFFNDEDQASLILRLIKKYKPEIFLAGASSSGRALVPAVAVRAHCGLTADCTSLDIDPLNGGLLQTRPAFGGNLMATIRSDSFMPQMATVRPGVMKVLPRRAAPEGILIRERVMNSDFRKLKDVLCSMQDSTKSDNHGNASFVLAGGRGMKGPEGFELLAKLAKRLGASLGATRAAVDAGWAPYGMQIGQTGRTVQPEVYMACGISGQIQHLVGMQSSDMIIAVNRDLNSPLMQMADIAIEGDATVLLQAMLDELNYTNNINKTVEK